MDKRLFNILEQVLQNKNEEFDNNQVFSMVSLITLNQIINLYHKNIPQMEGSQNLSGLLNQFAQGNSDTGQMDMEKIIPLLLSMLGGKNNNNLSSLLNLLNNSPLSGTRPDNREENGNNEQQREQNHQNQGNAVKKN